MLIICGTPQWISEQLLYVFINIVISSYIGSACDVPNKIVHLCDHHQKNYNLHDNEENSVKYITSNGGKITYHNNDENEIEKLGSMDNNFLLDDIHTCYENVTILYLAGYDDEIFELRNDLLKKGGGNELVIYFFLYRDHKIFNIGKIHTNIIFFDESILKYTHYYYLDSETVKNTCCFNKLRFENLEDNVPDEAKNESKSKYFTVYPKKENDGYEFIIPKEKDIVMKDIIVDLNKNKNDKLNKPAGSTSIFTSSLLDQPNDNEIYYVDEDFSNACINSKYLEQKDKKNYMKKNQTLKSHMEISPPIGLESKTEDFLDEQSKSTLSNTKRVLVPCNDDKVEQTIENLLTFPSVISTVINSKPTDTEKTRVAKIFKDKSIKNFQNHKDTTYYRLPKTLDSYTKTLTDQVYSYKSPFSDVNVKGFNIVAPILFQGNRIDNINDNNHVRPNDSHYYSHEKPFDGILLNAEYDINQPNYKSISHIHTSNQYILNKMLPTKVVSKNTDTQIKNIPFDSFKPLSSFSDGSYKNQDKILGSNVPYGNNYILNPSYVTYKQNLKPLENKKYRTINPVVDFSIPVITSSSNIKLNDENKKIASLPEAYSLYYRNNATQKKKYEPNKTLIHTPSILNIPCQKLTNDKYRVLDADSTNILNIPRDLDVSLINTNAKLSASPHVHGNHFNLSKYNINDKIEPEEIKAYPCYSKYEPLPASYVPKLHVTNRNLIPTTPYYLPRDYSNLSKSVNYRLHSFKTFASSTNTAAQSKHNFISSQPDVYQAIRTKVYQPLKNILESSNMPTNGNPNIIHYVKSARLIPFLMKEDLNKPETSALPLQPSIELVGRKPPNIVLTSSEQKGAQATYESPLNVVICKNKYAILNPNINIIKNLNFIKKASIPKLSTLNQDAYDNSSWFKKYQQNISELLPYTKLSYCPKIKPSTKISFQNSFTPSAPIYSSEIPKSPDNLIFLTLAPVSPETTHMSQKPVHIIEFPPRNDLTISSKNFQSTQFVSIPKFYFTSNQLDIDLRNPIKKQKPFRFRPNIYQYPSKYHLSYLSYEPDVMSDTLFKLSQHVLKPTPVPTLNRKGASSYVFNNKNLSSLTKLSHRFWPQNILTSTITSQIAAMSERNKMLYRPKENFKEYLLKSYLSYKPQVVTSPVQSLHEGIPNKPIIEDILPIPSYKKMFKVNKPDVSSKIIFSIPQERLKSSIPIFNQESPTTKDTVCIENLKLHTFPYVIKPLQYRNWPQNIITSPYMVVPARNQAKKNLYPLKPYLSAKPQYIPASAFPIISLPTSTLEIKSSSRSPVPGIRNIAQSDIISTITSQHVPMGEMNKYLHLSKQNVNQYPPRSYSTPEAVTTKAFSIKSPITPLPRVSSSQNLPLYETIPKKQTNQEILPSYIKLYKLNDPDISTNTIFISPFYMPNFNQESPTATGTLSYKNLKVQTNPCIEKPSQYLNWPQNIIPIASPYIVSPFDSIQKLHLLKQNLNLYPLKPYLAPQLQSEPVLAFPITSQTTSIPAAQSSTKSPVSAIRSWPKNILTSSIASPHLTTPERNKNLYLSKQNVTQYPPKLYSLSKPLQVFIKSPIIICPEDMLSSSPLPLYETAPTNSIIQEISPIIEPAISSNVIFTLPQQPLKLSLTNFIQEFPTTTDTLSNKNFEPQTNPCVTNHVPSQYRNRPQNNIPISSPHVVTPERNQNLHTPKKNLNQFPLQPYLSSKLQSLRASSFPFTELTHIPAVKSFLLPNKPAVKKILLKNHLHKQPYKLNKPDTLSCTKFPLPKQYYRQNLLHINQEPVLSKPILNLSYPKYITYKPKEVYSLPKQVSLPYDKFKELLTNEYKSIPKSQLNTVPSISPSTITKIWSPKSIAYAPLFNTISPSPTMKSVLLTQPTFKNSLHLPLQRIPLPSCIQYPYQHTSLDSNSLNISTKVDSISHIAISLNTKLYSPYLLPKKVPQNKISPKLSSSSNLLLENSLQFQIPTIQGAISKAKVDNLPLSSIDNRNNKKHYPHFETLPFSNMKSFLRNFKVPNQVIYIPFPSKMNLKSQNSCITSKSPLITSPEPSKSDLPCILSSTLAYPLQKSVLPFTPLAQSISKISPSQFRHANGQSLNLPTEWKLLKKLLKLPLKYDSIFHHPHYEPVQTLDTESSVAHFNLPNKYKNIFKSLYKNQNDLTYLTENQDQVSFNKDVLNTQPTFSKVLNAHPHTNYLPSLKTLELYPSYKPYTSTHDHPSLSVAKATNIFSPLQPNSNFIPFKSHLSYIQPFIKTPSYYQTGRQGPSAPTITPSYQSISVQNSPSRQFEPTSILTIPSKLSLLKTLQAPAASLFKSDLTSLSLPLLKSSNILSSYRNHPVYKTPRTLDSEISIAPPNLIKKSTWPLNKTNFATKTFGKYQNYQPFNSQDRVILNINNINTQPSMTPITKVTSKYFNKFKLYPSFKPLNIQAFKAPFSISNVDTRNKHILLQLQPDSSYLKPSEKTPIPDYYQTTSPNPLAWTKTITTGNSKDMGTLYHIQTSKSSTNRQLKKALTLDMNTLKPNLAYSSPIISSLAKESYHSMENADFLIDKVSAFEKSSPYPLQLNFKFRSNMYPIYKGSKIKYFTSNTENSSKIVKNLDTGKYDHINDLQKTPITKNQLYYKKIYPIISSINHRTHILSPLGTLNTNQFEFITDRERNLNIPIAKILQKSYKPDMGVGEITTINAINENIPSIRTQGIKQFGKEIPLSNISILKYDPREINSGVELETDNPDIFIKAWTSRIEVIKPRIVYDKFQVQAYNFEPIVKELGKYDPNVVEGVVKSYVEKNYGEPIVLKGTYSFYKPYIISNVNNKYLKHGKIYLVWPTLCDCGCKCLGCQCYRKCYK